MYQHIHQIASSMTTKPFVGVHFDGVIIGLQHSVRNKHYIGNHVRDNHSLYRAACTFASKRHTCRCRLWWRGLPVPTPPVASTLWTRQALSARAASRGAPQPPITTRG